MRRRVILLFLCTFLLSAGNANEYRQFAIKQIVAIDRGATLYGIGVFGEISDSLILADKEFTSVSSFYFGKMSQPLYYKIKYDKDQYYVSVNQAVIDTSKIKNTNQGSVRCSGTSKSGNRCKRMTTNKSGKCWQHERK